MKKALITGITGQSGSYLAELLLEKGYEVHGIVRRISTNHYVNIKHLLEQSKITMHMADMSDGGSLRKVINEIQPDEIYNLAGMSQVRHSYDVPSVTMEINVIGFLHIVEAVRDLKLDCKIYQACSSEMFGKVVETPQRETTPFHPRSPYGVSKAAAYYMARTYRESYGMKIYCGILFNHESPRRGEEFLSRKVCKYVAQVKNGTATGKLKLGNLDSKRDWGYAKEYMQWVHAIMQHPTPDDFVIATGETHSVKEFVQVAFAHAHLDWKEYVEFDENLTRPAEVDLLIGDATKSKTVLGFEPKVKFDELVKIMVDAELNA